MAGDTDQEDKTEDPTERRIEQSIERGEVPKSMEAAHLPRFGCRYARADDHRDDGPVRLRCGHARLPGECPSGLDEPERAEWLVRPYLPHHGGRAGAALHLCCGGGIASGLIMHKPLWTTEPMMPKFNRISPMAGFKRVFGKEALIQFVKSLLKSRLSARFFSMCLA